MRNKNNPNESGGRKDQPSGRQASEQPEHTGNAPSSLNQGQGPEFQTQDSTGRDKNEGAKEFNKGIGFEQSSRQGEQSGKTSDKKANEYEDPDQLEKEKKEQEDLPSREPGEKPYIGDNPEETRRQSPKME